MLVGRNWLKLNEAINKPSFIVMQWNILADFLCTTSSFPYADSSVLKWQNRQSPILEEIKRIKPDIICLEEVDRFDILKPFLEEQQLASVFYKKPHSNDGTVVAWRRAMFKSLDVIKYRYTKTGSQGAIIVLLEHKESNNKIAVGATHLVSLEFLSLLYFF